MNSSELLELRCNLGIFFNAGISDAGSSAALTWAENGPPEPDVVLTCDAGGYSRWPDGHVARSPFSQPVRPAGGG
jgi:hypothetical protein